MGRMSTTPDPQDALRSFRKTADFFVGIDSDGCAFDTMEVKHKECFIPNIVRFYGLAAVSKYVREVAEFLNLYSHWRGDEPVSGAGEDVRFAGGASRDRPAGVPGSADQRASGVDGPRDEAGEPDASGGG